MLSAAEAKPPDETNETKSESVPQPDLSLSSKNPGAPCIDNLIEFFLNNLNEKSTFKQIRAAAKIAIADGRVRSSDSKKDWIIEALTNYTPK